MTFWKSVLEFGPGIRFLLLGLDLKYHIWGLLEKSIIVVCVCSFSTTRYNVWTLKKNSLAPAITAFVSGKC